MQAAAAENEMEVGDPYGEGGGAPPAGMVEIGSPVQSEAGDPGAAQALFGPGHVASTDVDTFFDGWNEAPQGQEISQLQGSPSASGGTAGQAQAVDVIPTTAGGANGSPLRSIILPTRGQGGLHLAGVHNLLGGSAAPMLDHWVGGVYLHMGLQACSNLYAVAHR